MKVPKHPFDVALACEPSGTDIILASLKGDAFILVGYIDAAIACLHVEHDIGELIEGTLWQARRTLHEFIKFLSGHANSITNTRASSTS